MTYAWEHAGRTIHSGEIAAGGRVDLEGRPKRQHASQAWGLLLDDAAGQAFSIAHAEAAFGEPDAGTWITPGS